MIVTNLVRTRQGRVVHYAQCQLVQRLDNAEPWVWAEGRDEVEVAAAVGLTGSISCTVCQPLVPLLPVGQSTNPPLLPQPRRDGVDDQGRDEHQA